MFALISAVALASCEGALGDSPPHAAPANPVAEGADGRVVLTWNAVTDAESYSILWRDDTTAGTEFTNIINDIETTTFTHTPLVNLRTYRYRIVAETSGGRGPESLTVSAAPVPCRDRSNGPPQQPRIQVYTVYFSPTTNATTYRIYTASTEGELAGRRPNAFFEETAASPRVRPLIPLSLPLFYRVFAMNDGRIGVGGPVALSPTHALVTQDLHRAAVAFGDPNQDGCLDLPLASNTTTGTVCHGHIRQPSAGGCGPRGPAGRGQDQRRLAIRGFHR